MSSKNRILIVDDEHVVASSLAAVFAKEGYESRAAHSAGQALHLVSDWSPHLAIIDVQLKDLNGVEFAMQLRELYPSCQVALFTGLMDLTDLLAKAREAKHHFEVIQKPVHPTEILGLAARWLSGPEVPELSPA